MTREPAEIMMTLLSAAWRRRVLIIVPALLMPFVALFASLVVPRSYEARTTLLVQEPSKLNPFLNDLAIGPNVKDRIQALDALLHSENVLDQVLRDVGLVNDKTPGRRPHRDDPAVEAHHQGQPHRQRSHRDQGQRSSAWQSACPS